MSDGRAFWRDTRVVACDTSSPARTVQAMSMLGSMPEPSRFTQGDQIGPQPPAHPHPGQRKPRRHLLRALTNWLRRKHDA
jgi:hypothetical protein